MVELTYQITTGTVYRNDDLNVVLTKEDGEEEGTYNIIVNAENPNYEIELVNGIYTITVGFTSEKCFVFSNGKITNYYDYQENDSTKKECPRDVRIPGTINNVVVTSIGASAFKEKNITSVEIPSSVTFIDNYAFQDNKLSEELDLSNLTSLTSIGSSAFEGKSDGSTNQITSFKLPSSVTSIRSSAFQYNKLSGELDLSHLTNLTSIEYEAFTGSSTTNQITSLNLPSSVTSIKSRAFQYNKLSGELDLSHLTGLTSIGDSAFEGVTNGSTNQITSIKLPSSVKSIAQNAFRYNKLSGELDLSNLTGLTSIGQSVFQGSSDGSTNQITSIKLPSSITSIGNYAFEYNKLSGELDLSNFTSLKSVSGFCYNTITSIKLPSSVTSIGAWAFTGNKLTGELNLSNTGITSIGDSAFRGSSNTNQITSIKLPSSVTSIGKYAFTGNKLTGELDLSNTGITSIGQYVFQGTWDGSTNQITSIKLPSGVTIIDDYAFQYNKLSGELDLSNLTSLTSIGKNAFEGSSSTNQITSIKLPGSVTSIGNYAFLGNILTSVTFYGRSDLTGATVGINAWGWATDHSDADIHFEPTV